MQKALFFVVFIAISFVSTGQTFFAEQQLYQNSKKLSPTAFIWANKYSAKSNFGITVFALVSPTYGEILAGPNYTFRGKNPQRFVEIGTTIGYDSKLRGFSYVFFSSNPDSTGKRITGRTQGMIDVEYGKTGYWYVGFVMHNISESFAVGFHAQSFNGVWGPRIQFNRRGLMMYLAAGRNLELKENGALCGIRHFF